MWFIYIFDSIPVDWCCWMRGQTRIFWNVILVERLNLTALQATRVLTVLSALLCQAGPQQDPPPDSSCQRVHVPNAQQVWRFDRRGREREQRLHSSGEQQIHAVHVNAQ